jgi:hypothetical protein
MQISLGEAKVSAETMLLELSALIDSAKQPNFSKENG